MLVSLEECAGINNTTKINLQKLKYVDKVNGRNDRFKGDKVEINYLNPLFTTTTQWYFNALCVAMGNEKELARQIATRLNKPIDTIYIYFRNFKFKNQAFSLELIEALKDYVQKNTVLANCFMENPHV